MLGEPPCGGAPQALDRLPDRAGPLLNALPQPGEEAGHRLDHCTVEPLRYDGPNTLHRRPGSGGQLLYALPQLGKKLLHRLHHMVGEPLGDGPRYRLDVLPQRQKGRLDLLPVLLDDHHRRGHRRHNARDHSGHQGGGPQDDGPHGGEGDAKEHNSLLGPAEALVPHGEEAGGGQRHAADDSTDPGDGLADGGQDGGEVGGQEGAGNLLNHLGDQLPGQRLKGFGNHTSNHMGGQQGGGSNQHRGVGVGDKAAQPLQKGQRDLSGRLQEGSNGPRPVNIVQKRRNLSPNLVPVNARHRVPHGIEIANHRLTGGPGQLGHIQAQEKARQGLQANLDPLEEEHSKCVPVDLRHGPVHQRRQALAPGDPVEAVKEAHQELQGQIQPRPQGLAQLVPVNLAYQVVEGVRQVPAQSLHSLQYAGEGEHVVYLLRKIVQPGGKISKSRLQLGDAVQHQIQEGAERLAPGGEGGLLRLRELRKVRDRDATHLHPHTPANPPGALRCVPGQLVDLVEAGQGLLLSLAGVLHCVGEGLLAVHAGGNGGAGGLGLLGLATEGLCHGVVQQCGQGNHMGHHRVEPLHHRFEHRNDGLAQDAHKLLPLHGQDAGLIGPAVLGAGEVAAGQSQAVQHELVPQGHLLRLAHGVIGLFETLGQGVGL